ncbi:uncharacterized protein LOC111832160 [Capsella rubella]|uniref:uncharacterized protein LOC111832160 n=1 Tax=Capsella rubella TaxID=81985 RepID=UPI000CD4EA5C|nr:uncharacterized protein LOC111832160 [Capsella rubella]
MFLQHHMVFMKQGATNADLWTMSQKENEPLRDFMEKFKKVVSTIAIADDAAIAALRNALLFGSKFREDLIILQPATLDDAIRKASRYIEVEEEKAARAERLPKPSNPKSKASETKAPEEYVEPRQHYDREYARNDKTRKPTTFAVNGQEQKVNGNKPWNKWYRDSGTTSKRGYCEFHKFAGHTTEECRQLQALLLEKFKNGDFDIERERRQALSHRDNSYVGYDSQQHQRDGKQIEEEPRALREEARPPPPPKRKQDLPPIDDAYAGRQRVDMIMGGLTTCNDSVRSIRAYHRQGENSRSWLTRSSPDVENYEPITFTEADALQTGPNNDPLVVELAIGESVVTKILIDTAICQRNLQRRIDPDGSRSAPCRA